MAYFLFHVVNCYLRYKNIKLKFDIYSPKAYNIGAYMLKI